ncbi:FmdB family zinc ribbon protein [Pandoraea sp. PE-S2T-3]|uniref:FmdB family zinc ribbon protein n=1 Tax=Pandoraea sp. PE-S2T-3 TaxID=1986993 RepID=UPI000B404221|nr:FmdB family zinc ribbon protein [Pandoraea sp. PE-S2T-3]
MPIYAYRCETCGFAKDVLQKMSDAPLSQCPECGKETFRKQVTAAGFQLKGSGWYVTDFRGGSGGASAPASGAAASTAAASSGDSASASSASSGGSDASAGSSASSASDGASSSAPAASCGGGCACH